MQLLPKLFIAVDRSFANEIFDSERSGSPESTVRMDDEIPSTVSSEIPPVGFLASSSRLKRQARLSNSGSIVTARQLLGVKNKADSGGQVVSSTTAVKLPVLNPLKMRLKVRVGDQLILVPVLERFITFMFLLDFCLSGL